MLKICVIGGANVDITASSGEAFRLGDSNPGKVEVSWGGVGRNIAHNLALLGDEVQLLTIFGGGLFGPVIARACQDLGIGVSHSDIAPEGTNSFFVSINNADGELLGGVADMNATEGITPAWLAARQEVMDAADVVVADANSSADALAWLIDHCRKPLFLDAVSVAKAGRIQEAVTLSKKKSFFALKCNAIENVALASVQGCRRRYVSVGAEGLKVEENGRLYEFPALPCLVRNVTGGGDALLAGIVHAGPEASVEESARWGLACAHCAVESPHAVSDEIKKLIHE
jgi:pseudouridine kinase